MMIFHHCKTRIFKLCIIRRKKVKVKDNRSLWQTLRSNSSRKHKSKHLNMIEYSNELFSYFIKYFSNSNEIQSVLEVFAKQLGVVSPHFGVRYFRVARDEALFCISFEFHCAHALWVLFWLDYTVERSHSQGHVLLKIAWSLRHYFWRFHWRF